MRQDNSATSIGASSSQPIRVPVLQSPLKRLGWIATSCLLLCTCAYFLVEPTELNKETTVYSKDTNPASQKPSEPYRATSSVQSTGLARRGAANVHYWLDLCSPDLPSLKLHPHFPLRPHHVATIASLQQQHFVQSYAQRIIGYFHPPSTGRFRFGLSCKTCCELYLGRSASSSDIEMTLNTCNSSWSNYTTAKESSELVKDSRYYFEVVHHSVAQVDHLQVALRHEDSKWQLVEGRMLSPIHDPSKTSVLQDASGSPWFTTQLKHAKESIDDRMDLLPSKVPLLSQDILSQALPHCDWTYSQTARRPPADFVYPGTDYCVSTAVYTPESSASVRLQGPGPNDEAITKHQAHQVAETLLQGINNSTGSEWQLEDILEARELSDHKQSRWLLDALIIDGRSKMLRRVSSSMKLDSEGAACLIPGFTTNLSAMVHAIIPVYNQGAWVLDLLDKLHRFYELTGDDRVTLIIVDYESTDLDVEAALKRSDLPHTTYLAAKGAFSRTEGIRLGASTVSNPNDIVFTFDLHLTIPPHLFDRVRHNTVLGRNGFNPVVARLECGAYPASPRGFWELWGYGLFSLYKADFDAIQGYDQGNKHTWGYEDMVMVDRVLSQGFECNRERIDGFYHYYHNHTSMWGNLHPLVSSVRVDLSNVPHPNHPLTTKNCTARAPNAAWTLDDDNNIRPASATSLDHVYVSTRLRLQVNLPQQARLKLSNDQLVIRQKCLVVTSTGQLAFQLCKQATTEWKLTNGLLLLGPNYNDTCLSWRAPAEKASPSMVNLL
eukprot:m.255542 g.255542  ORF g.255542 m.255542 type:complete len:777 (+) comp17558_c0_seq5:107-2437(+)